MTACAALTLPAVAQKTYSFPHALESTGRIVAIGWDLSGGQLEYVLDVDDSGAPIARRQYSPIGALYSLYGNDEFFRSLQEAFAGSEIGNTYSIYSLQKSVLGQNVAADCLVTRVRFPACNVNSKEPAGIEVYFNPKEYRLERVRSSGESKVGEAIAKRQKLWMPANFRVKLGNLPCSRITAVTNATGGTVHLPASRVGKGFQLGDIAITIPLEDAPAFREVLTATIQGKPSPLPLRLEYLDEDGLLLLALEATVYISSVEKENPLDPFDPSDAANKEKPVIVKVKQFSGHVTLIR